MISESALVVVAILAAKRLPVVDDRTTRGA
jgi:hypothetical protein